MKEKIKKLIPAIAGITLAALVLFTTAAWANIAEQSYKCESSRNVCEMTNIQQLKNNGTECIDNYKQYGLFGSYTTHTCEGYGDIRQRCVKEKIIPIQRMNTTECTDVVNMTPGKIVSGALDAFN